MSMVMKKICFLLLACLLSGTAFAQLSPQAISIPMSDGEFLAADLYLPNTTDSFPVILVQTPYNKDFYQLTGLPLGIGTDIANSDYAFVIVDWRCFYGSIGACVANVDRAQDGYDAVEWIAAQSWSIGRIGTWGPSALGNIQYQTARRKPPHLVCCVPEVAHPQTTFENYYPGGSARVEYLETLGLLFGVQTLVISNPYYNLLWQFTEDLTHYPDSIEVPMFLIGGWYDHNTDNVLFNLDELRSRSAPAVRNEHRALMGPWVHGGTGQANVGSAVQGELNFPQAEDWNDSLALRFFDYHLRNQANGWDTFPVLKYFQMGDNEWQNTSVWPPADAVSHDWYLHEDLSLREAMPGADGDLSFNYDPTDPSPTVGGRTLSLGLDQGPYDQAPQVESRSDVLVFSTPVLDRDMVLKGKVKVHLNVSSDRLDTDFTVRLTDVYPDGKSLILAESVQRMRFRNGYAVADTAAMVPGTIYPITLEFQATALTFLAGHRLRIIVGSSDYPRFNRNMNTFGEMYPNNNLDTLVNPLIATNSVHLGPSHPSRVELPLVGFTTSAAESVASAQLAVNIGPNPFGDHLRVDWQKNEPRGDFRLLDLFGREMHRATVRKGEEVHLPGLSAGVYLWEMRIAGARVTGRLLRR
jgi:predicted acyl esterase